MNIVTEKIWWLWTPSCKEMAALNAQTEKKLWLWASKLRRDSGFECQIVNMTLNVKLKKDGGSECHNWGRMVALNANQKKDMMTLNAELGTNNGSKCQTEKMTPNAKLKRDDGFEHWKCGDECLIVTGWWLWTPNCEGIVTLNAKLEMRLWKPN